MLLSTFLLASAYAWAASPCTDPMGHVIAMGVFGFGGYWAYHWDQRAAVLLAQKRAEIAERREKAAAVAASSSS